MFAAHSDCVNNDMKARYQRPEGKLIEDALDSRPKMSRRKLAEAVDLSEGRVRQIVNGYKTEGGSVIDIVAPADTLARIAEVLELTAGALEGAGRADVAELLRTSPRVGVTEEGDLWIADLEEEIALLEAWLQTDRSDRPPAQALALWSTDELMAAAARAHRDEVKLLNYVVHTLRTSKRKEGSEHGQSSAEKSGGEVGGLSVVDPTPEESSEDDESLAVAALETEPGLDEPPGGSDPIVE